MTVTKGMDVSAGSFEGVMAGVAGVENNVMVTGTAVTVERSV